MVEGGWRGSTFDVCCCINLCHIILRDHCYEIYARLRYMRGGGGSAFQLITLLQLLLFWRLDIVFCYYFCVYY